MRMDLRDRVKRMSAYLDNQAIAAALKIPVETVVDILSGKADISEVPAQVSQPTIKVTSVKTAYRQRVVAVWRARGGVGCTAIAIHLAYMLKDMMRVLLVDLNTAGGGSDLCYYLDLPEYPHMCSMKDNLADAVIEVETMLHVLQPPRRASEGEVTGELVEQLISYARRDYDAVILDLPNREDAVTRKAVQNANTLVMVTGGGYQEMVRLALLIADFRQKDIVLVANRCRPDVEVQKTLGVETVVFIPEEKDLARAMEERRFVRKGSALLKSLEDLRAKLYEVRQEKKGFLQGLFAAG
ncbi:MAG: AAA family ATPase, partial [Moorellaceae bacterium]